MRRPSPWLWLLAWAMTVLLFRAMVVGQQNKEPVHLRSRTASPFDERWGGDFNTSAIPVFPDSRGWNNHLR